MHGWPRSMAQTLIKRHLYGSVIVHIDKEMLGSIPVPLPQAAIMDEIGDLVFKANALRSEAWQMERAAIDRIEELVIPPGRG